jgi:hypothetical protein
LERGGAQGLVDALAGIAEGPALDGLAARRLSALSADEAARALSDLVGRPWGERERKALAALCRALVWGVPVERREAIRVAALAGGMGAVAALLTHGTVEKFMEDERERRADPELGKLTLGHKKQMARSVTSSDRIARLAQDSDPSVIENLLANPRVTEQLVVRIAARRPVPPAVLEVVARSRRWGVQHAVRRALAMNPCTPPTVANPILAQLSATDLKAVAGEPMLHPAVRDAARAILAARK